MTWFALCHVYHSFNIAEMFRSCGKPLLAGGRCGLLRPTRVSLGMMRRSKPLQIPLPPIIARIVTGVALVVAQSFWDAHRAEAERLSKEGGGQQQQNFNQHEQSSSANVPAMSAEEALQILSINSNLAVPLKGSDDRDRAEKNFKRFFATAQKSENLFLQGKLSCAYRVAVDPKWDEPPSKEY